MSGTDLVLLRGGISVPAAPYILLITLEARGITVQRDGGDLLVGPRDRLTPEDNDALRAYKPHLLMLLDYLQQPDLDAHLFTDQRQEVAHAC